MCGLRVAFALRGQNRCMSGAQIAAAVVAALFLALVIFRIRQGRHGRAALGTLVAGLLALYAAGVAAEMPDVRQAVEDSGDALGNWMYLVAAGASFFETSAPPVTFFFPGEFVVIFAGLLASDGGLELLPLMLIVWATSAAGDTLAFVIGRRFGRDWLLRFGGERRLEKLDRFFERWGAATIAIGRLLPVARPLGPLVAGSSDWRYRRFLAWNLAGTLLFAVVFVMLGYAAYDTAERLAEIGSAAGAVIVTLGAIVLAAYLALRRRARLAT